MEFLGINDTGWIVIFGTIGFVLTVCMMFFVIDVSTAARAVNNYLERKNSEYAEMMRGTDQSESDGGAR